MQECIRVSTQTCGMLVPRVARETIQSELVATIYAWHLFSNHTFCSQYFFPAFQNSGFPCFRSRESRESFPFRFEQGKGKISKVSLFLIFLIVRNIRYS